MAGANAYLTPPGSQGFAPHWDDIDALVLQVGAPDTARPMQRDRQSATDTARLMQRALGRHQMRL